MNTNLVIGSDGFIGVPFCQFLEQKGESVIRFDIKRGDHEDARHAILPLQKVDAVYFLAWDVGGSKYLYEPKIQQKQFEWNLALMQNVFRQLDASKCPFLFVSSQLTEEADTVYGATKRLGEVWTKLLGGVCVRVWNAYGYLEEDTIKSHVISDFIYQSIRDRKISMMTTGQEWRQFTHIDDLSSAFYMALHDKNKRRAVYDASSYEWIRIIDIAHYIAKITDAKVVPGLRTGHDPLPAPNMGRVPGWLPSISITQGIDQMVKHAQTIISAHKV